MGRLYSLAQHTVPRWSPVEILYNAKQLGFDMVSIRSIPQGVSGESVFDLRDSVICQAAKQAMDETGLFIHDVDLAAIYENTDVFSWKERLEAAAQIGVKSVVSSIWTSNRAVYTEKFATLCDLAAQYGLTVNLEFVTWSEIKGLKEAAVLLKDVDKGNARILVDTLHWHRSGVRFDDLSLCDSKWFDLIHICDIAADMPDTLEEVARTGRQERLYAGEGVSPIREIVAAMPEDAILSIEIPNQARLAQYGAYEFARRCMETTRAYFAK